MTMKIKDQQIKALEKTIKVWEEISKTPSEQIEEYYGFWAWKYNMAAKALGLKPVHGYMTRGEVKPRFACPLCEKFYETVKCPLGDCDTDHRNPCETSKYSYDEWRESTEKRDGTHSITLAKKFLKELKQKLTELHGE